MKNVYILSLVLFLIIAISSLKVYSTDGSCCRDGQMPQRESWPLPPTVGTFVIPDYGYGTKIGLLAQPYDSLDNGWYNSQKAKEELILLIRSKANSLGNELKNSGSYNSAEIARIDFAVNTLISYYTEAIKALKDRIDGTKGATLYSSTDITYTDGDGNQHTTNPGNYWQTTKKQYVDYNKYTFAVGKEDTTEPWSGLFLAESQNKENMFNDDPNTYNISISTPVFVKKFEDFLYLRF